MRALGSPAYLAADRPCIHAWDWEIFGDDTYEALTVQLAAYLLGTRQPLDVELFNRMTLKERSL